MWKNASYRLESSCPLILDNGQTADPLNEFSRAIARITSKRKRTDADYEEVSRLEFLASLYMGPDGPVVPAANINKVLVEAAQKNRQGPAAKAGCYCLEHMRLEYDGPRDPEAMWTDGRFTLRKRCRLKSGSSVIRTRVIFNEWSGIVRVAYEDSLVNLAQLDEWFHVAGTQVGMGNWRPLYGRFTARRIEG